MLALEGLSHMPPRPSLHPTLLGAALAVIGCADGSEKRRMHNSEFQFGHSGFIGWPAVSELQ